MRLRLCVVVCIKYLFKEFFARNYYEKISIFVDKQLSELDEYTRIVHIHKVFRYLE